MYNKKVNLILLFIAFISLGIQAQQDALYSQYMFNPLSINPAYAGTRNAISGVMLHRQQWVGIDGAPKTTSLAVHSPIKGKNFALGLNLLTEKIGPTNNSTILGTYAYHLNLGKGKLSFGLRGGIYSTELRSNELHYTNSQADENAVYRSLTPNFDFGAYYHTDKFYVGGSANHLGNPKLKLSNNVESIELVGHYMAFIGNAFVLTPNLVVKPSAIVKYTSAAPLNYDINTSILFYKTLWLGASYRSSVASEKESSIVFIAEFNLSESFRFGYSYDYNLGSLRKYSSGSHEVFIGADLYSGRKKSISPRYL